MRIVTAITMSLMSSPVSAGTHGLLSQCLNVVAVGDSITVGQGATAPYPATIATALSKTANNQGTAGIGWNYNSGGTTGGSSLINIAAANVDPLLASLTCNGAQPYLVLFAGINDLFYGASAATAYSSFQTYLAARVSMGWKAKNTLVATLLNAATVSSSTKDSFNALLIGGEFNNYTLVRLDLDPNIGCDTCNTNPTYFQSDHVHPTDTGLNIIANLVCLQMNPRVGACPVY